MWNALVNWWNGEDGKEKAKVEAAKLVFPVIPSKWICDVDNLKVSTLSMLCVEKFLPLPRVFADEVFFFFFFEAGWRSAWNRRFHCRLQRSSEGSGCCSQIV
jgi:hypothetical protein